jgi:hypothetical protein
MDRTQEHIYRHALLHADRLPDAPPDLDAYAEYHTASHLHCLPDPDAASYNHFDTHAYALSYVDIFSDTDTCYTELHLNPIADTHTPPNVYFNLHAYLYSCTHGHAKSLRAMRILNML